MKTIARKLLDRVLGYFVSRFLQPEFQLLKAEHARLASELRELAGAQADRAGRVSQPVAEPILADDSLQLLLPSPSLSLTAGERAAFTIGVHNRGPTVLDLSVEVEEPFGFGVLVLLR